MAIVLVSVHVALSVEPSLEIRLVVLAGTVGAVVEMFQIASGTYRFTSGTSTEALPPRAATHVGEFATTFRFSPRGVMRRPLFAGLFGAAGGSIAFLAGERLGAAILLSPLAHGLLQLSVSWAIALLVFSAVVGRLGPEDASSYRAF